jgi:hypothetical protein
VGGTLQNKVSGLKASVSCPGLISGDDSGAMGFQYDQGMEST